jgi:16S rRNA processing protein RimM
MIDLSGCIELGELLKPHGIKGQLILKLTILSFKDVQETEYAYIVIDGLPVPFFFEDIQERTTDSLIVKFESVDSESKAKKYSGLKVYIDSKTLSESPFTVQSAPRFTGFAVKETNGNVIGILHSVIDFEQNPLLQIMHNKTEILLPLQAEFLVSYDIDKKELIVKCPEGLLDIYQ